MASKLKIGERCPIHGKRSNCCGRTEVRKAKPKSQHWKLIGPGTREYGDGRIVKTPSALRRRKDFLLRTNNYCAVCGQPFADYQEAELGHIRSKGAGSWKRDDSDENTILLHVGANRAQGSIPLAIYLALHWKPEHCGRIKPSDTEKENAL